MLNVEKFSSIAHGNGEAIVGDWMVVGNVERGRASERDMSVRDVGGAEGSIRARPLLCSYCGDGNTVVTNREVAYGWLGPIAETGHVEPPL
jgi:hypothetical protein